MKTKTYNVLCVGNTKNRLNKIKGLKFTENINEPFELVAVFSYTEEQDFYSKLFELKKATCPIINLTGKALKRQDFELEDFTDEKWMRIEEKVISFLTKNVELQHIESSPDYNLLACLALSYTREQEIAAKWQSSVLELVDYPLLSGLRNKRIYLEELKDLKLLSSSPFEKVHICSSCSSSRLSVREECPTCNKSNLSEHSYIHHYRCAYQGTSEEFETENKLVCPKCTHELRHYGVDYDRSGNALHCEDCKDTVMDPSIGFICTDCGEHTPGETIKTVTWYDYNLTPSGQDALLNGKIPKRAFSEIFSNLKGVYNRHDFLAISLYIRESAIRYERDLTAFSISIVNMDEMRQSMSSREINLILSMLAEVISQFLRATDAVTVIDNVLFTVMNETSNDKTNMLFNRIKKEVKERIKYSIELKYEELDLLNNLKEFTGALK